MPVGKKVSNLKILTICLGCGDFVQAQNTQFFTNHMCNNVIDVDKIKTCVNNLMDRLTLGAIKRTVEKPTQRPPIPPPMPPMTPTGAKLLPKLVTPKTPTENSPIENKSEVLEELKMRLA